jgi:DNA-binding MarR family transcriptional regulator
MTSKSPKPPQQRHIFWLVDEDVASARRILSVLGQVSTDSSPPGPAAESGEDSRRAAGLEQAQLLLSLRRRRIELLGSPFSFEPPFIMLAALFAIEGREPQVNITRLTQLTMITMSTALRWLTVLERKGLIERGSIESDERLVTLSLTSEGREAMANIFSGLDSD